MSSIAPPEAPFSPALEIPTPSKGSWRLRIILVLVASLLMVLVAGTLVANASLSQTYSAQRAVQDYFAAQVHRDVDGMLANATFLRGEGSYTEFFSKTALEAMMKLPANSDLHEIKVRSVQHIDDSTSAVDVSMNWNGVARTETLTVRKDTSRVHWLLYPSWKVEIPSMLISVTLPNQPGVVSLDGIPAPTANQTAIQAIRGFHKVTMLSSNFWNEATQNVNAVDAPGTATLAAVLSDSAVAAAGEAVKGAFHSCDATKYDACFDHTYSAPDRNFTYYFTLPGYGNVNYTRYSYALTNDPTVGMKVTVGAEAGKVSVSGTCTATITVDGSRHYNVKGDYTGTLTWTGAGFGSDVTWTCDKARA